MAKRAFKSIPAKGIRWDLGYLYKSIDDKAIMRDKKLIETLSKQFTKKYKGKINSPKLSAPFLSQAIKEIEALDEKLYILGNYSSYLHSQDTKSEKIGAFYQETKEFSNKISVGLIWFMLEWQQLDNSVAQKLIKSPSLDRYHHFLEQARAFAPFRKSESEEAILTQKALTGSGAFARFYDETSSQERFAIGTKKLTMSQLSPILKSHPSRNTRKQASESLTQVLKNHAHFYTFTINNLLLDKKVNDEIRGFKYPEQATFLSYEVDPKVIGTMVKAVTDRYSISSRFYKAKSNLLKQKLYEWDRYSPLFPERKKQYSWEEAKSIVLDSFKAFSPVFFETAKLFFDKKWIDAEITPNKRSGGYCSYSVPSKNPMILVNYSGNYDDVSTLAHELGHGIHAYLSRQNSLVNFYPSTATAEIASVFCESVLFERIYSQTNDPKLKLNLLANKIQGGLATIFRQTAFYLFEKDLHTHRREKGELSSSQINNYFQERLKPMFGQSLALTQNHGYWWMPVLHFYHYNFYVFTYAFGEALTNALYEIYRENSNNFVPNYIEALKLGGSKSPAEIVASLGIDISSPKLWKKSLDLVENQVTEFERLANGVK